MISTLTQMQSFAASLTALSANASRSITHTVSPGDSLSAIASQYGVSLPDLIAANPQVANVNLIYPGQQIDVPVSTYEIQPGDSLWAIADRLGTTVGELIDANNIANPDMIFAGDVLIVPGATGSAPPPPGVAPAPEPAPAPTPAPTPVPTPTPVPAPPANGDFNYNAIVGVANNPNVTPAFISEVEAMAERLGTRPEYLMAVMSFETGGTFSSSVVNNVSGATGLIQFIPPTARGLGTSTAELARMTPVEQLAVVEQYFEQYPGRLGTLEGVYTSVLSGRATPDPDATLVTPSGRAFVRGNIEYTQNAGLDFNNDGRITSGEATSAVASRLYGGVTSVQQQLVDVGAVPASQAARFADGQFGPNTSAALGRFQGAVGLPQTGLLDDATGRALFAQSTPIEAPRSGSGSQVDLQLSQTIHERGTPGRQTINSPVIGEFILTEGFMARGGPHSSKNATLAIFADNPTVAENIPAGVYNLGIDYVNTNGRIQTWFGGEVVDIINSNRGYGNRLIMQTDFTFNYQGTEYPVFAHYAHADSFNVSEGDTIVAGQDIGDQGSTGGSTGDHVDFLSWITLANGQRVHISPNLLAAGQ
ncbi:MAG: LysM peptidoglycan-binding domain-containing protein [Gammaproteobacteria bacterium]